MFTGIIEETGTLKAVARQENSLYVTIAAVKILHDLKIGDSIAVNGVCLTAVSFDGRTFSADVMPETFRRTNLAGLRPGSPVNLERAMAANGRFGGHIVQGHVDTVGEIVGQRTERNAVVLTIAPQDIAVLKHVVPKGSVALDGISLTVVSADEGKFSVSIIPHTLANTVLHGKRKGDTVNIETDILGKYVERMLRQQPIQNKSGGDISLDFLAEHGFA